jgi:hypothetical protein
MQLPDLTSLNPQRNLLASQQGFRILECLDNQQIVIGCYKGNSMLGTEIGDPPTPSERPLQL